jgi:c-di-GMP-binding flagellar brake protein YcgR
VLFLGVQVERRKFPRVKPEAMFRVQCYSAEFAENPLHRNNMAVRCLDLSPGGACIVTPGRLRVGASMVISVDIPDTATRFRGKAVVRWSQSVEKQGREAHVAGMQILEVTECQGERVAFLGAHFQKALPADGRQKHRRVLVNEAEVLCSTAGLMGALGLSGNIAKSLLDLSEGGCKLILEKKVEVGQKVKVQFAFKHPALKVASDGIVRRCDRDTMSLAPKYETGIEFQNMSNDDAGHLRVILKAFLA